MLKRMGQEACSLYTDSVIKHKGQFVHELEDLGMHLVFGLYDIICIVKVSLSTVIY